MKCIYYTNHCETPSHVLPLILGQKRDRRLVVGVNMDSNTSLLLLLLLLTLSKTQWSTERHNSLLFTAHSLTSTNITAPFCALVYPSGVAKVITAYCLLSLPRCWIWRNVPNSGLRRERGSYWSCHQYSNCSSQPSSFYEGIIMEPTACGVC